MRRGVGGTNQGKKITQCKISDKIFTPHHTRGVEQKELSKKAGEVRWWGEYHA